MDLRQKLSFLRSAPVPRSIATATDVEVEVHVEVEVMQPAEAAPHGAREQVLSDLRSKISEILGRPSPPRRLAEPSETSLPFTRVERPEGILYQRLERLAPSHHVGIMPVDSAAAAKSEMLALLALDPSLSGLRFERALFLDTETTGLGGGAGVLAFLLGMSWFDEENRLFVEQLLLRRPADEPALLARLRECVERADVIVTYNGKAFDWPLLSGRCVMNRLPPLPVRPHLDLLHIARRLHKSRLGQCRLVTLESEVLGFGRGPDVAGSDIAARYSHFLRTGDETSLSAVVLHNAWDVVSMAALVGLYGEPIDLLPTTDLLGLSRTLRRAGALDEAARVADAAVERGGGAGARRMRGEIAKARGDRALALREFESALSDLDDPALRLELAKLYEHYMKAPGFALTLLAQGTSEDEDQHARRRARLERKIQAASEPKKPRKRRSKAP
ncbi:MAG: ribonuclease H-like domain-containing protein [Myxococcota bacterium]